MCTGQGAPAGGARVPGPALEALKAGDGAYQRGDFEGARDRYGQALEGGLDGARVLYNLGNAYSRTGELGRAIACYRGAAALAPRDADVQANLARAMAERKMGAPAPPASWLHVLGRSLIASFTLSEFAVAAAALYWLGIAFAAAMILRPNRRRRHARLLGLIVVLCVLVSAAGVSRWWSYHHVRTGVVAEETAQIRSGPGESFETVQRVYEGTLVRVLRGDGGWVQVVVEGGARGWVRAERVAKAWHED